MRRSNLFIARVIACAGTMATFTPLTSAQTTVGGFNRYGHAMVRG